MFPNFLTFLSISFTTFDGSWETGFDGQIGTLPTYHLGSVLPTGGLSKALPRLHRQSSVLLEEWMKITKAY